jgi:hypothetical protein
MSDNSTSTKKPEKKYKDTIQNAFRNIFKKKNQLKKLDRQIDMSKQGK